MRPPVAPQLLPAGFSALDAFLETATHCEQRCKPGPVADPGRLDHSVDGIMILLLLWPLRKFE